MTIDSHTEKELGCKETALRFSSIANRDNIRNIYTNAIDKNFDSIMLFIKTNLDTFCVQLKHFGAKYIALHYQENFRW